MTYGEYKRTSEYINAEDIEVSVNGEEPIEEMYYPEELDHLPVVGCGYYHNTIHIDLVCLNWEKRYEPNWCAKCQ